MFQPDNEDHSDPYIDEEDCPIGQDQLVGVVLLSDGHGGRVVTLQGSSTHLMLQIFLWPDTLTPLTRYM